MLNLTLFLTKQCNARCPFCFYSAGKASKDELSTDEYSRISRALGNLLWLAFSGGEPLLRDDIVDIAKEFYRNNNPSIILISTNGLMPSRTRAVAEQMLSAGLVEDLQRQARHVRLSPSRLPATRRIPANKLAVDTIYINIE